MCFPFCTSQLIRITQYFEGVDEVAIQHISDKLEKQRMAYFGNLKERDHLGDFHR
jgi:hypothetical protein